MRPFWSLPAAHFATAADGAAGAAWAPASALLARSISPRLFRHTRTSPHNPFAAQRISGPLGPAPPTNARRRWTRRTTRRPRQAGARVGAVRFISSSRTRRRRTPLPVWASCGAGGAGLAAAEEHPGLHNWCAPPCLPQPLRELGNALDDAGGSGFNSVPSRPRGSSASSRPPTSSPPTA